MKTSTNAHLKAIRLLEDIGVDEVADIGLDMIIAGLDATLIEEDLKNCEGRIIFGNTKTIIKINSLIQFEERKRFVLSHEIGHLVMHKGMKLPDDTFASLNIVAGTESLLQNGRQELEANEFASELLMPSKIFLKEARGKKFSPLLIKQLSERFNTSLTATIFKYLQFDELHPICVVMIENGRVKYWKKSDALKVYLKDIIKLPPPEDSVAQEYLDADYKFLYSNENKAQEIEKSTWFTLSNYDVNSEFYEYCIPSKRYKAIISVIWED